MWLVTEMDHVLSAATKPTPIGSRLGEHFQNAMDEQIAPRTKRRDHSSGVVVCYDLLGIQKRPQQGLLRNSLHFDWSLGSSGGGGKRLGSAVTSCDPLRPALTYCGVLWMVKTQRLREKLSALKRARGLLGSHGGGGGSAGGEVGGSRWPCATAGTYEWDPWWS